MVVLGSYQKELGSIQHFPCASFLHTFSVVFLEWFCLFIIAKFAMFNTDLSTTCLHVQ